ncbi:MAG: hypothetical protein IPK20_20495 [Betaproteobacteria bacterium]|nr:hypothetical protein [Betaproteobacteria bacterium]
MPQNKQSGVAGNQFGRTTAPLIAREIGARMLGTKSNEAELDGERIVIKCARAGTLSVGVSYLMLKRIRRVLGAFEQSNGSFCIYSLTVAEYSKAMTPTRSKGPSAGKVGIVRRAVFETRGTQVATIYA